METRDRPGRARAPRIGRRRFLAGVGRGAAAAAAAKAWPALGFPAAGARIVRIAVVGGRFGATFFWHKHPSSRVTAVCDIRPDRLARLKRVYGCPRGYESFDAMLEDREVDAVAVFTPAPLHVPMTVAALRAGKHVICAVPAAMSLEECRQLIDEVERSKRIYMMAETSYYRPETITARAWYREGRFGTIFYSEAEYHHEGVDRLWFDEEGRPTWRHGFPPLHYATHCTSFLIAVTGERLVAVTAAGWGDGDARLAGNPYANPYWNETAFFQTSGGHAFRCAVYWHVAAGVCERGQWLGEKRSFSMPRPSGEPAIVGRGAPEIGMETYRQPNHWERLPLALRVPTPHGNSHTFLTHEFVTAVVEGRRPAIDVYEAVAYTAPGFAAHESALRGGVRLAIPSLDREGP